MAKRNKAPKIDGGAGWSIGGNAAAPPEPQAPKPPAFHQLMVYERKAQKGHMVTIIEPFQLAAPELKALAKELKKLAGGGGTTDEISITLQGEHAEKVSTWLKKQGWGLK